MRGGRSSMSGRHHNTSNGRRNDNHNNRSSPSSKSSSRSKSLSRRGSSGQSSLSAHIQQQMERPPRRKGRDPSPLSRRVYDKSAPDLNYRQPPPSQPSTFLSPPRRSSAGMPRRTNQLTNNSVESSPSSSQERAAIAANLAKNSFSAHQNLQKLIDEQWERDCHRMEHAQKMQGHQLRNQQVADLEVAQSITKIMTFHRRNSAPGIPSHRIQIDSYDDGYDCNYISQQQLQQQKQQRRSKSQPMMDRMDKYDSIAIKIKNEEFCSLHSNSTAPTTALSLSSESQSPTSEPSNRSKQPQLRRKNSSTLRYPDRETLYNHLHDAPRESRVHLTRHIENLQVENHRLNELNLTQTNQIDKLESEIAGLMKDLLRYRLKFGDMTTAAEGGESLGDHVIASPARPRRVTHTTAVESIFDSNAAAGQRSFKEAKKADTQATRVSAISNQQLLLMLQQQEQEEYQQDEVSRGARSRSNSLEDKFEHQRDGSCFIEQKGGNASLGRVPGSVSVPSMTDTDVSCSLSYSTPDSVIEKSTINAAYDLQS